MSERKPVQHVSADSGVTPGALVLYPTDHGSAGLYLRAKHGTAYLSEMELAELLQTSAPNINIPIKNVLAEGELQGEVTIKDHLIVRTESSNNRMQLVADERNAEFDVKRRKTEALGADAEDLRELEAVEKRGRLRGKNAS